MQALESFHGRGYEADPKKMQKFCEKLAAILAAVPARYKKWLEGKLRHAYEPTLQDRIAQLHERLPDRVKEGIGDGFRFAELTAATRNYLTHFDPDAKDKSLAVRRLELGDVIHDPESGRLVLRAMPSSEVAMELKTAWHRNRDKPWTSNDIHDIDALSLAVPYCDVVVTEKACHHALTVAGLGTRMHTALLRDLRDLPRVLAEWKSRRSPQSSS